MNESHASITCEEFQQLLPELVLSDARLYTHPHLQNCATCRKLVVDLEMIADGFPKRCPQADYPLDS